MGDGLNVPGIDTEIRGASPRGVRGRFRPGVSGNPDGLRKTVEQRGASRLNKHGMNLRKATRAGGCIKRWVLEYAKRTAKGEDRPRIIQALGRVYDEDPRGFVDIVTKLLPKETDVQISMPAGGAAGATWAELFVMRASVGGPASAAAAPEMIDGSARVIDGEAGVGEDPAGGRLAGILAEPSHQVSTVPSDLDAILPLSPQDAQEAEEEVAECVQAIPYMEEL